MTGRQQDGGAQAPLLLTYVCQADPVDHLDSHPPMFTFVVLGHSTADAVNTATRLLNRLSPGLQLRSCVPKQATN
jgi:hypothetical protein